MRSQGQLKLPCLRSIVLTFLLELVVCEKNQSRNKARSNFRGESDFDGSEAWTGIEKMIDIDETNHSCHIFSFS